MAVIPLSERTLQDMAAAGVLAEAVPEVVVVGEAREVRDRQANPVRGL
jgi:hypothetical protein